MGIKITRCDEAITVKNVIVTMYGSPSSGKTSLAYTADKVLLLDFDRGSFRANNRLGDTVQIDKWNDIADITNNELSAYKTVVIDTVGNMIQLIISHIETTMPGKAKNSMLLYGEVARIYKSFITRIKSAELDLVFLAHFAEEKKGENVITRIDAGGKSKNDVYQSSDLLGFLSYEDGTRILDFNPVDGRIAKNTGKFEPINLTKTDTKLSDIIQQLKDKLNTLSESQQKSQQLQIQIAGAIEIIDSCKTPKDFNILLNTPFMIENEQVKLHMFQKAKDNNLFYNKETKQYENKVVE